MSMPNPPVYAGTYSFILYYSIYFQIDNHFFILVVHFIKIHKIVFATRRITVNIYKVDIFVK